MALSFEMETECWKCGVPYQILSYNDSGKVNGISRRCKCFDLRYLAPTENEQEDMRTKNKDGNQKL